MGAVGCDEEGSILVKKANEDGVDTQYQYIDNIPTGKAALLNYLQPTLLYLGTIYNLEKLDSVCSACIVVKIFDS